MDSPLHLFIYQQFMNNRAELAFAGCDYTYEAHNTSACSNQEGLSGFEEILQTALLQSEDNRQM